MTPEQLVAVILVILGVILQLAFLYAGSFATWYQNHPQKGLLALGFSALIGLAYFGLSCTPYAAQFKIALTCEPNSLFTLGHAIYIIAITQQAAFLILPKSSKG